MGEKFLVLTTHTDLRKANELCSKLESSGIPVLLEHVELTSDELHSQAIRVLVPTSYVQRATSFTDTHIQPLQSAA